jgi:hypothetical protein
MSYERGTPAHVVHEAGMTRDELSTCYRVLYFHTLQGLLEIKKTHRP